MVSRCGSPEEGGLVVPMVFRRNARLPALAAFVVLAGWSIPGATQDAATPAPWTKFCQTDKASSKELCVILQESRADTGQFIASATIRQVVGEPKFSLIVSVLPGMMIQPGIRVQVDGGAEHDFPYGICMPEACFAELPINDEFVNAMKSGSQLTITTVNAQAKSMNFPLTLSGFATVYDGPAQDPAKRQAELEAAQKARNEGARQKLIDQQKKSAGQTN
jgi:invasion protein IalB